MDQLSHLITCFKVDDSIFTGKFDKVEHLLRECAEIGHDAVCVGCSSKKYMQHKVIWRRRFLNKQGASALRAAEWHWLKDCGLETSCEKGNGAKYNLLHGWVYCAHQQSSQV